MQGSRLVSVNLTKLVVHFEDGDMPISNMIDRFGEETTDPKEACVIVAQEPNGEWVAIDISDYRERVLH